MNILILTPRMPFPPFRGDKLKIYNIAKNLAKSNKVTILTFIQSDSELIGIHEYEKMDISVIAVKQKLWKSVLNCILLGFSGKPFQQLYYKSDAYHNQLQELLGREKYNVIYYHLIRMAQYELTDEYPEICHVSDYTDAVSLYLTRLTAIEKNPIKKMLFTMESNRVRKAEVINTKFDLSYVCSDSDRQYLAQFSGHETIRILPNGIEIQQFSPDETVQKEDRFLFTGNMPYFPNIDAVQFFSKEIFPSLSKKYPTFKFYIVGQDPPEKIKRLSSEKIVVTGFVRDIRLEYLKSKITVAPMRFGAGTLNKIIESMALGTPVIASNQAVSGMNSDLKQFIFTADSVDEYVKHTDYILSNYDHVLSNQKKGIQYITNNLSWEKIVSDFENDLLLGLSRKKNKST